MAWYADVLIDPGGGGDHLTLNAFEDAYDHVDISATDGVRGRCKGNVTSSGTHWTGWQAGQDSGCTILIEPDQSSYWPDGVNDAAGDDVVVDTNQIISEPTNPMCMDWRGIEFAVSGLTWGPDSSGNLLWVTKSVFRDRTDNGIYLGSCGTTTAYIGGCLFRDCTGAHKQGIRSDDADATVNIVNCTFADYTGNFSNAVWGSAGTVNCKNCAEVNCTSDWNSVDAEVTCLSEIDGDVTDNDADDFTKPSTDDYTVYDASSALYEAGTTENAAWFTALCATDFAGTTWGGTPAVGCFELVATGSPSASPSGTPSATPSGSLSASPSGSPSESISGSPSESISGSPSESPSESISGSPSESLSGSPSASPSESPSESISGSPSASPSESLSESPSESISGSPSESPSERPSESLSSSPSESPSESISGSPSESISGSPSESISGSPSESLSDSPSASLSGSPSASPSESPSGSPSESISGSPSESISGSPSESPSESVSGSPSESVSGSPSESPSESISGSPSGSPSESPSGSPSGSPSAGTPLEIYSRGSYAALPGDDTNLETDYIVQDYLDVNADDGTRVSVAAEALSEYVIHQFKDLVHGMAGCYVGWNGQSALAPSVSTVRLQVYNYDTSEWENLDSDNVAAADTDFNLNKGIADLTDYKSPGQYLTCRVYQQDA